MDAIRFGCFLMFLTFSGVCSSSNETNATHIPDEKWGYVTVRPDAHMFWWLYGADTDVPSERLNKPLIMWLQGGPGASSTGYGNFKELGPLTANLAPRNTSWTKAANVLFVDNPVGTGFSYVTSKRAYTTNLREITADLMVMFKEFLDEMPVFKTMPFYIFCESYGGKYTSAFGVALYKAIHEGQVACDFKGVALGDSWISPVDSVLAFGPYLYSLSLLDESGLREVNTLAAATAEAVKRGNFEQGTYLYGITATLISELTDDVYVYNVLRHNVKLDDIISSSANHHTPVTKSLARWHGHTLSALMNGPIRRKLGIIPGNVTWGGQSLDVYMALYADIMKPVIHDVSQLLNYGLKVVVYEGQLDMICSTTGAEMWMKKLEWDALSSFLAAKRQALYPPSGVKTKNTGAFVKAYRNLHMYYILKSGHMVPADAGEMALEMVKLIIRH